MEARLRLQPSQERPSRLRSSTASLSKSKPPLSFPSFSLCSLLKTMLLCLGLISLFLLLLLNAWQSQDRPLPTYHSRSVTIEERKTYSDLINYAADFNGATVIDYSPKDTKSLFESFFASTDNSPTQILSSDNAKGKCWGFAGNSGMVSIRILKPIYPLHFVVKHINLSQFESAPREFCVYRREQKEVLLGCYEFFLAKAKPNPEFTQVFNCIYNCNTPATSFTFKVLGNHGGDFTCVYQVMITGDPVSLIL
jgi:hypothetical protein